MRFLVVDDESVSRSIVKNHLSSVFPESEIIEAENGAQAICLYFNKKPDIIFLDILMPVASGEVVLNILEESYESGMLASRPKVMVLKARSMCAPPVSGNRCGWSLCRI